jgi:hypothetical protein
MVDHQNQSGRYGKMKILDTTGLELRPSAVQLVASRFTDCAGILYERDDLRYTWEILFIIIRNKMLHKPLCCNVLRIYHNAAKEETAFHLSRTRDNLIHTLIAISLETILILSRDNYTLQTTVTHRLVFSVTVFIVLLGNGFQRRTFLCSRTDVLAGDCHLTPISYSHNRGQNSFAIVALPHCISSGRTAQKTSLPTVLLLLRACVVVIT